MDISLLVDGDGDVADGELPGLPGVGDGDLTQEGQGDAALLRPSLGNRQFTGLQSNSHLMEQPHQHRGQQAHHPGYRHLPAGQASL